MIHRKHPVAVTPLVLRLLVLATAVAAVFLLLASTGAAEEPPGGVTTYVVQTGDTMWEIAGTVAEPGDDLRRFVSLIMEMNGMDGATIYPGQTLALPGA